MLVVALATGCSKEQPGAEGMNQGQVNEPMPPASPRGPGPIAEASTNDTVIADTGDVNATLQQLTQALRDYVVRTRSVPKNFDEFASKSQAQFPPAPEGKKYAITGQSVVLVKR